MEIWTLTVEAAGLLSLLLALQELIDRLRPAKQRVRPSNFILGVGVAGMAFSLYLLWYGLGEFTQTFTLLGLLFLLSVDGLFLFLRRSTVSRYDQEEFVTRNLLGIRRRHSYREITALATQGGNHVLYFGKRKVQLRLWFFKGSREFLKTVKKEYREIYHDANIPARLSLHQQFHRFFRGNLASPGGKISCFVALNLALLGFFLLLLHNTAPIQEESLTYLDTPIIETKIKTYVSYRRQSYKLILSLPDGKKLTVYDDDSSLNFLNGELYEPMRNGEQFRIGYYSQGPWETDESKLRVATLSQDDTVYVDLEEINQGRGRARMFSMILLGVLTVLLEAVGVGWILAGRHPERHPNLARMLFQRGDWSKEEQNRSRRRNRRR